MDEYGESMEVSIAIGEKSWPMGLKKLFAANLA